MAQIMKLKECCTIIAGQSPESKYYNKDGDGIPFFQGKADFGVLYPKVTTWCSKPIQIAKKNDILLSIRAPVGPTNLSPGRVCIGRGLTAIRPHQGIDLRYLLCYFKYFEAQLQSRGNGTTFNSITQSIIKNLEVPVPSLEKQQRIVSHIEELFSDLDDGVATLEKTKKELMRYRQAVLNDVFSNVEHKASIREKSEFVTSGSRGWAKYYSDSGARFIRITDLSRERIELKNDAIQYVSLPENAEGKRSLLSSNDVLVSITADLGSIGLVPENIGEAYINQHIAMIRLKNSYQGRMIAWYLKSEYGQEELLKNRRGGGKLGLGLDDIRDTHIPDVGNSESDNLLSRIEERMSVCDEIEHTIDTALQQSQSLRQSILKKAFEGELVHE